MGFMERKSTLTKDMHRTTIRIDKMDIVEKHMFKVEEKSLRNYINRLIREDILKNGDEETIKKYFKEQP